MSAPTWSLAGRLTALVGSLCLWRPAILAADDSPQAKLRQDVTFLASDECEGRGVSTNGINLAADYIATEFRQAGLSPVGPGGSFFQPFTMTSGAAHVEGPVTAHLRGPRSESLDLRADEDFRPLGLSGAGKVSAPLIFAGYGITAPDVGYDDFRNLDVTGKIVLVLRRTPRYSDSPQSSARFAGNMQEHHAALLTKAVNAALHKASAVLIVSDRGLGKDGDPLLEFADTAQGQGSAGLPTLHVHRALADRLLRSGMGTGLSELEDKIDRELKPQSAALTDWTADLDVSVHRATVAVKNVVGVAPGTGLLAGETLVVGAHYDHLGYGGPQSLARGHQRAIHHGADDNASGTAVLLDLARRFCHSANRRPGRRLVFIAFSGEESGLLGSDYYCKHPLFPLEATAAMVNMDMVGRLRADRTTGKEKLVVYGTGTSPSFAALVDAANGPLGLQVQKVAGASLASERSSSDHASFYAQKIPVLFLFTGNHPDYHRPSDTADKINIAGMARVADFAQDVIARLRGAPQRPAYVRVATGSPGPTMHAGGRMPRLGIRPSYGDELDGVLLDGVSDSGPAARAGLKEGDRIVEIGGQPVKDLNAYMVLLAVQKRGLPLTVGFLRDGKRLNLQITPE